MGKWGKWIVLVAAVVAIWWYLKKKQAAEQFVGPKVV
jgi:hypothetical protein